MKICLLTEGSYPYVVGGVSAWVHMLMEGLPEFEFTIYSIGAFARDRGNYKYKLPENCTGIREVFLDEILSEKTTGLRKSVLTPSQRETLTALVRGEREVYRDLERKMKKWQESASN